MESHVIRLLAALRVAYADNQPVAEEAMLGNLRRRRWMVLFIAPFNLLCVVIF